MERPLKVVRIVTRLNVGGPTRHISILNEHLPTLGIDGLTLAGPTPGIEGNGTLSVSGRVLEIPTLGRAVSFLDDLRAFVALVRVLRRERPDVVHTHQSKAGILGRWAAWFVRVPRIVHTYHGFTFRGYFGPVGSFFVRGIERLTSRVTDVVICQDALQRDELIATLGPNVAPKCHVIPPSVAIPEFNDQPPSVPPRVVFPARLVPIKDPHLVLDVFLRIDPQVELDIVGDGIMMEDLKRRVDADPALRGRVHFLGHLAEPWEIYHRASVGVLTSLAEGTPLALIELQILGTRVVATDVGGVRGVVDPRGGEVVARSVEELARALSRQLKAGRVPLSVRSELRRKHGGLRLATDVARVYRT